MSIEAGAGSEPLYAASLPAMAEQSLDPGAVADVESTARLRAVQASASYLLARLGILESRVRALIAHRRDGDPAPDDPFRGLYLSDEQIDQVLADGTSSRVIDWEEGPRFGALESEAEEAELAGVEIRLRALARRAGLVPLDVDLLLVALAPDLDARFERLYGYLNDDVTRRRATIALGLELAGTSPWSAAARARLSAESPLIGNGLVLVEEMDRPYLSRSLRVPDRVAAHLLGDDEADPEIADLLTAPAQLPSAPLSHSLGQVLASGAPLAYLREPPGTSAPAMAVTALREAGMPSIVVDLSHVGPSDDIASLARLVRREAVLVGAGLVIGPVEAILERGPSAIRSFTSLAGRTAQAIGGPGDGDPNEVCDVPQVPVVVHGRAGWEPLWSRRVPVLAEVTVEPGTARRDQWQANLGEDAPKGLDVSDVTGQFLLSPDQVARAVEAARLQAALDGRPLEFEHLRAGARAQNGAGLERLARRIRPGVGWDDLVLGELTARALMELAGRARHRDRVLDEWGMRPGGGRGRGITALFAGDSGTGKTMSAEVVAGDLGLDLYTVNLATVVDKYVGETEKNLERIFVEANGVNAVLLFDEADAIFGKRSEVKDSNDRYANIEVAYLLQRMETFDGIAILATNLRSNVDDAFARRLDMIIDFPTPDVDLRVALWEKSLSPAVPRAGDIDLEFLSRSFELSGGNIRSVAITAAYSAADSGRPLTMLDLVRAVQQEYRKLGRLVVPAEFGRYYALLT